MENHSAWILCCLVQNGSLHCDVEPVNRRETCLFSLSKAAKGEAESRSKGRFGNKYPHLSSITLESRFGGISLCVYKVLYYKFCVKFSVKVLLFLCFCCWELFIIWSLSCPIHFPLLLFFPVAFRFLLQYPCFGWEMKSGPQFKLFFTCYWVPRDFLYWIRAVK